MQLTARIKILILLVGDVVALYGSLIVTLLLRYQGGFYNELITHHATPFSIIFVLWVIVFYIAGLYDIRRLHNYLALSKILFATITTNAVLSILFFYFTPALQIAPKTNLFVFLGAFVIIETLWRRLALRRLMSYTLLTKTLLIGENPLAHAMADTIKNNPQLGYTITRHLMNEEGTAQALEKTIASEKIELVLISRGLKHNKQLTTTLYELVNRGIEVRDLTNFYEFVVQKVPLDELEESWFIDSLENTQTFYDPLKRAGELLVAGVMQIILLPLEAVIAIAIATSSKGSTIYKQKRVGKKGKEFTLYKFRTMCKDAENNGAQWSHAKDERVTPVGKLLRYTHLDELPQLWNIIKGDLSFVGPRPERPEFVKLLKEKLPYYNIRHLIAPGITGWAQINYRYGASVEDSREKLEYDIYYLKNRSVTMDIAIILKTIKRIFINPK